MGARQRIEATDDWRQLHLLVGFPEQQAATRPGTGWKGSAMGRDRRGALRRHERESTIVGAAGANGHVRW